MAISHRLAELKMGSFRGSSSSARAAGGKRSGCPAANNLARHEAQPPKPPRHWCVQWRDFHHRFARFGDHKGLALGSLLDQPGEMRLGLVDVDGQDI